MLSSVSFPEKWKPLANPPTKHSRNTCRMIDECKNRLTDSTSPYLLQHASNPVHWEPWGLRALARAVDDEKPIFLSIGYSACHWCHVMAHESFENEAVAALLNRSFVSIKVDREERPDLDSVYMAAVQLLTGRGGWPMSVFLTPTLEPFFAGTYWPPEPRQGMPGFLQVLAAVSDAWDNRRDAVTKQATELTHSLQHSPTMTAAARSLHGAAAVPSDSDLLDRASRSLSQSYDSRYGGFGSAPKFPHPMDLRLLLRTYSRSGRVHDLEMVTHTLAQMAAGGMHDQIGGGFSRYSVDERWLVPHFEKMLSDNALLAVTYLEAFLATGREEFATVVRSTLDYLVRERTDPSGGLWSAEDADSEGEEGKFYVWTPSEIAAVLGPEEAAIFCLAYDATDAGNFEGHSILNLPRPLPTIARECGLDLADLDRRLADSRTALRAARQHRVRPGNDDKVLVAWNGLAIDSLARAGASLKSDRYTLAAVRAADFLLSQCRDAEGRLAHQWRQGRTSGLAFAEDLACLAEGLISLYEATFDERWIVAATGLADVLLGQISPSGSGSLSSGGFIDPATGAFFQTSADHEKLIVRHPDLLDNATPSSSGMAATMLLRLASLTGHTPYRTAAEAAIAAVLPIAQQAPSAVSQSLIALDWLLGPAIETVLVGQPDQASTRDVVTAVRGQFRPREVLALRAPADAIPHAGGPGRPLDALFHSRPGAAETVTLYQCSGQTCLASVSGLAALAAVQPKQARP